MFMELIQSVFDSWSMGLYSFLIIPWGLGNKITLGERVQSQVFYERHGNMGPQGGGGRVANRKVWKKNNTQNIWSGKQSRSIHNLRPYRSYQYPSKHQSVLKGYGCCFHHQIQDILPKLSDYLFG